MNNNLTALKDAMVEAAELAAIRVRDDFLKIAKASYHSKSDKAGLPDFVTQTDRDSETLIKTRLLSHFPDIAFRGEETGLSRQSDIYFLADPIDGTSNFVTLKDYFAVCVAYVESNIVKASVIADPIRGNTYTAIYDQGAFLERSAFTKIKDRLRSNTTCTLREMQLECEIAFTDPQDIDRALKLVPHFSGLRKSGSTALDLAFLAAGRPIGVLATNLESYDLAAGLLIAREAGAKVSTFSGQDADLNSRSILALPAHIDAIKLP